MNSNTLLATLLIATIATGCASTGGGTSIVADKPTDNSMSCAEILKEYGELQGRYNDSKGKKDSASSLMFIPIFGLLAFGAATSSESSEIETRMRNLASLGKAKSC